MVEGEGGKRTGCFLGWEDEDVMGEGRKSWRGWGSGEGVCEVWDLEGEGVSEEFGEIAFSGFWRTYGRVFGSCVGLFNIEGNFNY